MEKLSDLASRRLGNQCLKVGVALQIPTYATSVPEKVTRPIFGISFQAEH